MRPENYWFTLRDLQKEQTVRLLFLRFKNLGDVVREKFVELLEKVLCTSGHFHFADVDTVLSFFLRLGAAVGPSGRRKQPLPVQRCE